MNENEWKFIDLRQCDLPKDEQFPLFRYELAREISNRTWRPLVNSTQTVFPKHFPNTPYLDIPEEKRCNAKTFAPKPGAVPMYDELQMGTGITNYEFRFLGEDIEPQSFFSTRQNSNDEECVYALDKSVAFLNLTLDLQNPDSALVEEFEAILKRERHRETFKQKRNGIELPVITSPILEKRGSAKIENVLKQFGAARLLRHCGSIQAAQEALLDAGLSGYQEESAWRKAKDALARWRETPPLVTPSGNSVIERRLVRPKSDAKMMPEKSNRI